MKLIQSISLVAATVTTGLMAGLFAAFAYAIMPALDRAGDRTFIETMQRINIAILNDWFMVSSRTPETLTTSRIWGPYASISRAGG